MFDYIVTEDDVQKLTLESEDQILHKLESIPSPYFCYENCKDVFDLTKKIGSNGVVVEIGAWMGRSTVALALNANENGYKVYSIDPWLENFGNIRCINDFKMFENWNKNLEEFGVRDYVTPIKTCSSDTVGRLKTFIPFDLLLIDGLHNYKDAMYEFSDEEIKKYKIKGFEWNGKYYPADKVIKLMFPVYGVKVDYDLWAGNVKNGGHIALHDIKDKKYPAVDRVWNEEIVAHPELWTVISDRNNLGIARNF